MKKPLLFCLVVFVLNACVIAIGENGYRFHTEESLKYFKPCINEQAFDYVNYEDSIFVYEVSSTEVKQIAKQTDLLWVHLCGPHCPGDRCHNSYFVKCLTEKFYFRDLHE